MKKELAILLANQLIDGLQKNFIAEDKDLLQDAIDAVQVIIAKAIDDTPNGDQFKAMLHEVVKAVKNYQDSGEGSE